MNYQQMKMHERKQDEGKENYPLSWIKKRRNLTGKKFFYSGWEKRKRVKRFVSIGSAFLKSFWKSCHGWLLTLRNSSLTPPAKGSPPHLPSLSLDTLLWHPSLLIPYGLDSLNLYSVYVVSNKFKIVLS